MNLPLRHSVDISKGCWKVIASHFIETEIPEIERDRAHLVVAVMISSAVSKPNVKALVGEVECWGQRLVVHYPSI
jgi:hypothetical protein